MIAMGGETVGIRLHIRQLAGIPHADQIRRDQAALPFKLGNHIAPEIGRGRIAVQEQDRRALAALVIGHAVTEHVDKYLCERLFGHGASLRQKLIDQGLILIVDPAFVEPVIEDRIHQ